MRRNRTRTFAEVAILAALATLPLACSDEPTGAGVAGPEKELIDNAVSAAPESLAGDASVVVLGKDGSVDVLREGKNKIRCVPDNPDTRANDPICVDEEGFRWLVSLVRGEEAPANTKPGIAYVLQGGWAATEGPLDAQSEETEILGPHWAILWPFDPEATGLPTEYTDEGPWIMWAGTPYAHLMINEDMGATEERGGVPALPGIRMPLPE